MLSIDVTAIGVWRTVRGKGEGGEGSCLEMGANGGANEFRTSAGSEVHRSEGVCGVGVRVVVREVVCDRRVV